MTEKFNCNDEQALYKRFSQEEQRGLTDGGSIHVTASLIAGRSTSTRETQDERNERQETDVETFAKQIGIWHDDAEQYLTCIYDEPINSGQESLVYYDANRGVVIKTSNTLQYHDLQNALDSITLHNTYFPESTKEVIGFGMDEETGFQIITVQPYVAESVRQVTQEEITLYVKQLTFNKHEDGLDSNYKNGQISLRDLSPKNVIRTPNGKIAVIDAIMRFNKPELGSEGDRNTESENKQQKQLPMTLSEAKQELRILLLKKRAKENEEKKKKI